MSAKDVIAKLAEYDTEFGWRPASRIEAVESLSRWREEANAAVRDPEISRVSRAWFESVVEAFDELGPSGADRAYLSAIYRQNPSRPTKRDVDPAAIDKFTEFHRFGPNKIKACPGLVIPARVKKAGAAKWVTYRSNKVDPGTMQKPRTTFDYIHEHDAGVAVYVPAGQFADGIHGELVEVEVPKRYRPDPKDDPALVVLGKCLGFCFVDPDKVKREAKSTAPYPDLLCSVDGHCLYVVQSGREVLAMMWGGALGVFARGIDG